MAEQQENPIYWDQHASRWNLTLIFSLVVAVLGLMTGFLLTALGLAMGAYSWLTTPRQYLLYRDRMTIVYGMPRTRNVSLAEVSHSEVLAMPFGQRLRMVMLAGNRMMLSMRDPMAFHHQLEEALARYKGEQTGENFVDGRGTVLGPYDDTDMEMGEELAYGAVAAEQDLDEDFYAVSPEEPTTYTGHVEEAASTSGSYVEAEEPLVQEPEATPDPAEQSASVSGSFTETQEPDFSGEGSPAYGAEVEIDTGASDEPDEERPPSPY